MTRSNWSRSKNICCSCGKEIELVKDLYEYTKTNLFFENSSVFIFEGLSNNR